MTRKDYVLIAECVRVQTFATPGQGACQATAFAIANAIALELALDNPRFDRARFMRACGFGA